MKTRAGPRATALARSRAAMASTSSRTITVRRTVPPRAGDRPAEAVAVGVERRRPPAPRCRPRRSRRGRRDSPGAAIGRVVRVRPWAAVSADAAPVAGKGRVPRLDAAGNDSVSNVTGDARCSGSQSHHRSCSTSPTPSRRASREALDELAVPFEVRRLDQATRCPRSPTRPPALIVLGGSMHVHQGDEYPLPRGGDAATCARCSSTAPRSGASASARSCSRVAAGGEVYARQARDRLDRRSRSVATTPSCTASGRRSSPSSGTCTRASCRRSAQLVAERRRRTAGLPRRRTRVGHAVPPEVDGRMIERLDRSTRRRISSTSSPAWSARMRAETPRRTSRPNEAFCRRLTTNFLLASDLL